MPPRVPIASSKRPARPIVPSAGRGRIGAQAQIDAARARLHGSPQAMTAVTAAQGRLHGSGAEFDQIQAQRAREAAHRASNRAAQDPNAEILRALTALDSRLGRLEKKADRLLEALGGEVEDLPAETAPEETAAEASAVSTEQAQEASAPE